MKFHQECCDQELRNGQVGTRWGWKSDVTEVLQKSFGVLSVLKVFVQRAKIAKTVEVWISRSGASLFVIYIYCDVCTCSKYVCIPACGLYLALFFECFFFFFFFYQDTHQNHLKAVISFADVRGEAVLRHARQFIAGWLVARTKVP